MLKQRIEAIQPEMDKGEKADFSQFRDHGNGKSEAISPTHEIEDKAAKVAEEERQSYHRSRIE